VTAVPDPPTVRQATASDAPAITEMLVRAFDDDPVANFMFAGGRRRRRGLHSFFGTELRRNYLPHGHVYTTDDLSGAALWGPPDRVRHPVQELFQLLPTAPFLLSPHTLGALRLWFTVEGLHPKEPHWYLFTLGTAPERQGKGVGSALLRSMLRQVDSEGEPAYLESSKERNVPLYSRFGFEVIEVLSPTGGSPTIWRMWREPRVPEI
jgi:GNAT superfamily N-acetyltransferase